MITKYSMVQKDYKSTVHFLLIGEFNFVGNYKQFCQILLKLILLNAGYKNVKAHKS